MQRLAEHLARYRAYHRDRRNVATHMIGIPLIVLAVLILLSRPVWAAGPLLLTPAMAAGFAASLWYWRLDRRFGLAMAALLAGGAMLGLASAALSFAAWLGWGAGLFVAGWLFQFAGHAFEGRRPAFVDDLAGLLVGPLFVLAECAFFLGLREDVRRAMDDPQRDRRAVDQPAA